MSAYVKSYIGPTKWMQFLLEDDDALKNLIIFVKKPSLICKRV